MVSNINTLSNRVKNILINRLLKDFTISVNNDTNTILVNIPKKDIIVLITYINDEYRVLIRNCNEQVQYKILCNNQNVVKLSNDVVNVIFKSIR